MLEKGSTAAMTEFELKFQLPPERVDAVVRALARGKTARQLLEAHYFDTPDGALARFGVTLRLRKEGRQWVQTAKAAGESLIHRLEHKVPVDAATPAGAVPAVDWRLHAATPVGELIDKALSVKGPGGEGSLSTVYQTRVQRLSRVVSAGPALVEVALDKGWIEAMGERVAVSELEFELKKGSPQDAISLAMRWHASHGGWLSTISKAERGQRLARHETFGPARTARPPAPAAHSGHIFAKAVLHECIEQVLVNGSEVIAGSTDAEHVHQLRVGIRRLRTAVRELAELLPPIEPDWHTAWLRLFRELGAGRDRHYLAQLQARLEAGGGPVLKIEPDAAGATDPVAAVRSPSFQKALLAMLELVYGGRFEQIPDADAKRVRILVAERLGKLRKAVLADGGHFDELPAELQHRVRKRVKRLRYLAEFVQGLFRGKKVDKFIAGLKPLQDALGDYNDELLALAHYSQWAGVEPCAWFGAGWLRARREDNAKACTEAICAFADVRPFWK